MVRRPALVFVSSTRIMACHPHDLPDDRDRPGTVVVVIPSQRQQLGAPQPGRDQDRDRVDKIMPAAVVRRSQLG
jgi:hypothetical protein